MEFMRARINCPDRAQEIRTGPTLVPLSLGLTHLTWSEAWRMHALFILEFGMGVPIFFTYIVY